MKISLLICLGLGAVLIGRVILHQSSPSEDSENGTYILNHGDVTERLTLKDGKYTQITTRNSKTITRQGAYNSTGKTGPIRFDEKFLASNKSDGFDGSGATYSLICPDYDSCSISVDEDVGIAYQKTDSAKAE